MIARAKDQRKADSLANKFRNIFLWLLAASFRVSPLFGTKTFSFFAGSFFGHAFQQVNLSFLHQTLLNIVQQKRFTFDLEIEATHCHISLGVSVEQFISFHALGRQSLLVSSCGLPSNPLNTLFFARWETTENFGLGFLHNSGQMCFKQKLYRHPLPP